MSLGRGVGGRPIGRVWAVSHLLYHQIVVRPHWKTEIFDIVTKIRELVVRREWQVFIFPGGGILGSVDTLCSSLWIIQSITESIREIVFLSFFSIKTEDFYSWIWNELFQSAKELFHNCSSARPISSCFHVHWSFSLPLLPPFFIIRSQTCRPTNKVLPTRRPNIGLSAFILVLPLPSNIPFGVFNHISSM